MHLPVKHHIYCRVNYLYKSYNVCIVCCILQKYTKKKYIVYKTILYNGNTQNRALNVFFKTTRL